MYEDERKNKVNSLIEPAKQMLENGKNLEDVVRFLKEETQSKVLSIAVLIKITNMSPNDGKYLVHTSDAWADVKARDEEFHEKLLSDLDKMSKNKD